MFTYVLDASVAAKWLIGSGEPLEQQALALLAKHAAGEIQFIVPDLFWPELGNVLLKSARNGRTGFADSLHSLLLLRNQKLPTFAANDLLDIAFEIAREYNRSFYDAVYLALASSQQAVLLTADERFANATAAHLPVKWLGSL